MKKWWRDLEPDPRMVAALDYADARGSRADALDAGASVGIQWSNRFADACARMVARELRRHRAFKKLQVLPGEDSSAEPPMFVAPGKKKKIDVVAASAVSGLQVGISLKGSNFRDRGALNFDKNLTGRTYELQDEARVIHAYQPSAFLTALYFIPLASTDDKRSDKSPSSFARVVEHLRGRTGRIDPTLPSQLERVEMSAVALYVPGDVEDFVGRHGPFEYRDTLPRGVVRYFDVMSDPPKRGRPRIDTTLSLEGLIRLIAERYESGGSAVRIDWADPEPEPPGTT